MFGAIFAKMLCTDRLENCSNKKLWLLLLSCFFWFFSEVSSCTVMNGRGNFILNKIAILYIGNTLAEIIVRHKFTRCSGHEGGHLFSPRAFLAGDFHNSRTVYEFVNNPGTLSVGNGP